MCECLDKGDVQNLQVDKLLFTQVDKLVVRMCEISGSYNDDLCTLGLLFLVALPNS